MNKHTFTMPYGPDNEINPWGDYDRLRLTGTRENGMTIKKWELLSSRGAPDLLLNDEQTRNVLEIVFIRNAERRVLE